MTGAGKTTLLDLLARRANFGTANGDVYVDGRLRDASFQRKIGYVQQDDIHLPTATVREALEFSALLRQTATQSTEQKLQYVDSVINVLDMQPYADAVVGVPGHGKLIPAVVSSLLCKCNLGRVRLEHALIRSNAAGLNIEQRKRLSIGVELVTKPELLLFLGKYPSSSSLVLVCIVQCRPNQHPAAR